MTPISQLPKDQGANKTSTVSGTCFLESYQSSRNPIKRLLHAIANLYYIAKILNAISNAKQKFIALFSSSNTSPIRSLPLNDNEQLADATSWTFAKTIDQNEFFKDIKHIDLTSRTIADIDLQPQKQNLEAGILKGANHMMRIIEHVSHDSVLHKKLSDTLAQKPCQISFVMEICQEIVNSTENNEATNSFNNIYSSIMTLNTKLEQINLCISLQTTLKKHYNTEQKLEQQHQIDQPTPIIGDISLYKVWHKMHSLSNGHIRKLAIEAHRTLIEIQHTKTATAVAAMLCKGPISVSGIDVATLAQTQTDNDDKIAVLHKSYDEALYELNLNKAFKLVFMDLVNKNLKEQDLVDAYSILIEHAEKKLEATKGNESSIIDSINTALQTWIVEVRTNLEHIMHAQPCDALSQIDAIALEQHLSSLQQLQIDSKVVRDILSNS